MSEKPPFLSKSLSPVSIIVALGRILLVLSSLLTLTGFLGKFGWLLDLTSHFRVQYLVIQLLCLLLFLIVRRGKLIIITLLFISINAIQIVPWYIPASRPTFSNNPGIEKLKILLINVHTSNTEYAKTMQYIKEMDPDLLALEEINERWLAALSSVLTRFPYRKIILREGNFGIALFSRLPLQDPVVKYFGRVKIPNILSQVSLTRNPVTILFTHVLPPSSVRYFRVRNTQLEKIASSREEFGERLILIGDLNTTSWSYYYRRFISRMRLRDSRKGFGLQPSWPTMEPFLRIAIDHCFVSEEIVVLDRRIGPDIGSDHYPVYIELGLLN